MRTRIHGLVLLLLSPFILSYVTLFAAYRLLSRALSKIILGYEE